MSDRGNIFTVMHKDLENEGHQYLREESLFVMMPNILHLYMSVILPADTCL